MKAKLPSKAVVRAKAESEMKEYAVVTAYLFVVFAAVSYFKFAILQAEGIDWAPWVFALVKAAIAAKFILIGRALRVGEGQRNKPLIWPTLYKSLSFLAFVAILTIIEEVIVGLIHGHDFRQSIAEIGGGTPQQVIATMVIVFLVFMPMSAFWTLGEVMGEEALVRAFFVERMEFQAVQHPSRE